jgi:hypothetical protein
MQTVDGLLVCQVCGRRPATLLKVRRHVGMIVMQRFVSARAALCRDHGVALAKDFLRKTLVQGWWGLISFFVNFYAVYTDLVALSQARKLPAPVGAAPSPSPPIWTPPAGLVEPGLPAPPPPPG